MKEAPIRVDGVITETLPNATFTVKVGNMSVFAYASGKIKKFLIKISVGDEVVVELSPYDLTKGRIVYRK